jgi:hypothetical protein
MASGHVNRTNRPNTWLHRPSLRREDSPCQLGAVHTWHSGEVSPPINRCLLLGVELTCGVINSRVAGTYGLIQRFSYDRPVWLSRVMSNAPGWKSKVIAPRDVPLGGVPVKPARRRQLKERAPPARISVSSSRTIGTEPNPLVEVLRPWTFSDDADLAAAARHGASLHETALFLCRSPDEVGRRGVELALEWNNGDIR